MTEVPLQQSEELRFARYMAGMLLLIVILYVSPYVLLRLPRTGTSFHHELDFAWDRAGTNADIVILGESSALHGENPTQISSALHLKAVNLPNTLGALIVTGQIELQRYLQTNKRPKLLVFYLAPWNLNYRHNTEFAKLYEGEHMLMRHGSASDIFDFAMSYPLRFLEFPFRYYAVAVSPDSLRYVLQATPPPVTAANMGFVPDTDQPALTDHCQIPKGLTNSGSSLDTAKELLEQYRGSADQVMVYVAPIPGCAGADVVTTYPYVEIGAAPPQLLAADHFVDDSYYTHVRADSAAQTTQLFIDAARKVLDSGDPKSGSH